MNLIQMRIKVRQNIVQMSKILVRMKIYLQKFRHFSGTYICSAFNDHGFISANQIVIDRNHLYVRPEETADRDVIFDAYNQARYEVESAENETMRILFDTSKNGKPQKDASYQITFDILSFFHHFRFTKPPRFVEADKVSTWRRKVHCSPCGNI